MPDRWTEEREREWRERNARYGRPRDDGYDGYTGDAEERSFGARGSFDPDRDYQGYGAGRFAARRSGPERDRVFGERETGESYTGDDPYTIGGPRQGSGYGRPQDYARDAQDYVRENQDFGRGGRFYGDDGREKIYRETYGQGGRYYGPTPRGYDAQHRLPEGSHRGFGFGFDLRGDDYTASDYGRRTYGPQQRHGRDGDYRARDDRGEGARGWFEKAREEVSSWFNGGEAEPSRGGERHAGHRGRGPKGYQRSDERITEEAHERLTDDPWVDASGIQVSVSAGEVTLSGTVVEREAKHRAERIVEDISGVNHVQNNLRVDRGNFLTRPTAGFGDSASQAQMQGTATASETGTGLASSTDANGQGLRGKGAAGAS
jgi:osmotically-inducible protein OsmY